MSALLQVDGVSKRFRGGGSVWRRHRVAALDDVSVRVDEGRTLGLVGESGSGKSTLGRCILGLVRPDSGRVVFDGRDVHALSATGMAEFRRRVQPVFQDPFGSLDPRWTIGQSVRESLDVYRIGSVADRERRMRDLLDRVGINPALSDRLPSTLSGGQRQRVGIAAALASDPGLIVADEPVSALDVSVQAQILNLFMDLQNDLGVATVFITHDLGVVEHISDEVAVLHRGRVVEVGPTAQVIGQPRDPYTRALIAAIPQPHASRFPTTNQ
jgi:ABC-type glutathione transport system ATPase component